MDVTLDWRQAAEYVLFGAALVAALGVLYRRVFVPMVKSAVKESVQATVNGGLTHVEHKVDDAAARLDRRLDRHDQRHEFERSQLVSALERSNISPPDGWRAWHERRQGGHRR